MDSPGTTYLYTLATVSATFVSLSSVFVALRQALGAPLTKYDVFLTRNFLRLGFLAVAGSLLPPLTALLAIPTSVGWRIAGVLVAIPVAFVALLYPSQRFAATGQRMPIRIWLDVSILVVAAIVLVLNTVGLPMRPGPGAYALGISLILLSAFLAFLHALELMLHVPSRPLRRVEDQHGES